MIAYLNTGKYDRGVDIYNTHVNFGSKRLAFLFPQGRISRNSADAIMRQFGLIRTEDWKKCSTGYKAEVKEV